MDLEQLAKAINAPPTCWSLLIYGDPGTGKTQLAATIAKNPDIDNVLYVGLENGHETLKTMVRKGLLLPEHARKIQMVVVDDSPEQPLGFETCGKIIANKTALEICLEHGRVDCPVCRKAGAPTQIVDTTKWRERGCIIIDSGSQLADSIMSYYTRGKGQDFKPGWDEYGPLGLRLVELLTVIQRARTNWIVLTHVLPIDIKAGTQGEIAKPEDKDTYEKLIPLVGTKPFSLKVSKYFGHRIYMHLKLRQHKAGSSTTYMANVATGSRSGWKIEDLKDPDLSALFDAVRKDADTSSNVTPLKK